MPAVYLADCWCDSCAEAIKARIRSEHPELVPDDPGDERTYDSDEWPKYMPEDEEADTPQHCAGGEDCLEGEVLVDSQRAGGADTEYKVGKLLSTSLTAAGVQYVKEYIRDDPDSQVVRFWYEQFSSAGYDLPNPSGDDEEDED
jgi:hypothetical protein